MNEKDVKKLLIAAGRGELEVVRKLIEGGLPVNASNHLGYTPLMSACASYRFDVVSFLLQAGADVGLRTTEGHSALHVAVGSTPSLPAMQHQCVKVLIEKGIDVDAVDDTGGTALMNAAWFGCDLAVRELLAQGADKSIRDAQGRTAEDLAVLKQREAVTAILKT